MCGVCCLQLQLCGSALLRMGAPGCAAQGMKAGRPMPRAAAPMPRAGKGRPRPQAAAPAFKLPAMARAPRSDQGGVVMPPIAAPRALPSTPALPQQFTHPQHPLRRLLSPRSALVRSPLLLTCWCAPQRPARAGQGRWLPQRAARDTSVAADREPRARARAIGGGAARRVTRGGTRPLAARGRPPSPNLSAPRAVAVLLSPRSPVTLPCASASFPQGRQGFTYVARVLSDPLPAAGKLRRMRQCQPELAASACLHAPALPRRESQPQRHARARQPVSCSSQPATRCKPPPPHPAPHHHAQV